MKKPIQANKPKKLILFDIDGTLISWVGKQVHGLARFQHGMKIAWGIEVGDEIGKFEGVPEWKSAWEVVKLYGISRPKYEKNFPVYVEAMHAFLDMHGKIVPLYGQIPDAMNLVADLHNQAHVHLGVLSANAERTGRWKLQHCNLHEFFSFGLWGDNAETRVEIAQKVFHKAQKFFRQNFLSRDIVVVGDTIHDIQCGKAIGAVTIAVKTGGHTREQLYEKRPDLLVDSLMDERVLSLLGLKK